MATKFKMSPGAERALADAVQKSPQWAQIQRDANEKARAAVQEVNGRMAGKPFEDVLAELIAQVKDAGFEPNPEALSQYAASIAEGTLR